METPVTPVLECSECTQTFIRQGDLVRHMKSHNREQNDLHCPYDGCGYKTLQRSNLKTHLNTHTRERPHVCPEVGCIANYGDPASLTRHRKRKHGYNPKAKPKTLKEKRRERRAAPYPSQSTSSTSGSAGSASPLDPSLDVSGASTPEIPCVLDQTAPLSRVAGRNVDTRITFAAYSTELIETPQANDPQVVAPSAQTQESLPPPSGSMTVDVPSEPLLLAVDRTTSAPYNNTFWPSGYPYGQDAPPSYTAPMLPYSLYSPALTSTFFSSNVIQPYTIDAYYSTGLPTLDEQYGYATDAASFYA